MSLFPMFVKLEGRLVVVVGGGSVAEGKVAALLSAGARIRVITPKATQGIAALSREQKLEWRAKPFVAGDLAGAFLVVAATSAPGVNEAVYREADRLAILCNAVDDVEHCHFYYGSVVRRGDLQIAISTNGKSPALAQRLRKEIEAQIGPEYARWLDWLGAARELLRAGNGSRDSIKALLHHLASRPMFERYHRSVHQRQPQRGAA